MNFDQLEYVLRELGCRKIRRSEGRPWVAAPCPFAPYVPEHRGHTDNSCSFGATIEPNGRSRYRCLTCQRAGELRWLISAIERASGADFTDLKNFASRNDSLSVDQVTSSLFRAKPTWYSKPPVAHIAGLTIKDPKVLTLSETDLPELPETELEKLQAPDAEAMAYLTGPTRKLNPQTIADWGLLWQPVARRVGIPVRDLAGKLVGISGRAIDSDKKPKFLHSTGFKRDYYLFGEHKARQGGVGCLVEGFFDVIGLHQAGYNAVAMCGTHLSWVQQQKLCKMFKYLILIPDGDAPGREAVARVQKKLAGVLPSRVCPMPDGRDPDELSLKELRAVLGEPNLNSPIDECVPLI